MLGKVLGFLLHLPVDLLVHPGNSNEDGRTDFGERLREMLNKRAIGEGNAVIKHREVDVSGGDVRERKKRHANVTRLQVETMEGAGNVRCHVAVGEQGSLGSSRRSRRINNGGEVVGGDGATAGIELGVRLGWALLHEAMHVDGVGSLDRIHHDHSFERRLVASGKNLLQLLFGGDNDDARTRIAQDEGSLHVGERGVNGYDHGAQKKGSEVSDGPLRAIFTQDGEAISLGDSPSSEGASESDDITIELLGADWYPPKGLAVQHDPAAAALRDRKEDVVKSIESHPELGSPEELQRARRGDFQGNLCFAFRKLAESVSSLAAPTQKM